MPEPPPRDPVPSLPLGETQEAAWIEVIRKMDEVYSDLIRYEVDLEEKNKALEEAQRFITSVLSSMSDVLVVCDAKGRVQQVNKALVDLAGRTEDELLGQPVHSLFTEADWPLLSQLCAPLSADGGPRDCEARLATRDGASDPVAINCSVRLDHRGRPAGHVLIGRPVGELRRAYQALNRAHDELKQAQQQLVQFEKMASIGRLVAGVAHELNNPISFVYGNVHSLQRYRQRLLDYLAAVHAGVPEEERERLRRTLRIDALLDDLEPLIEGTLEGAERVSDIVKNLKRMSFQGGSEPQEFDLAQVIRTAVQWTVKNHTPNVEIVLDLPEALPVKGDAGQIHQVVVNLMQNALDAVAERTRPLVRLEAGADEKGGAVVAVIDNGPGIDDEHLLRVFDPFFTTKPVGDGTGLGLWISYGILRDHGGDITAANAPDGGAVFTFRLPGGAA